MDASVSIDNKPKTLPPYGPPPHPHPASHPLHHPPPPGPQPRMLPPSDGPHHALPTPHAIYDQQWRQPYPHPHYESADQRRHSTAGQPHNPPHPPPHPSYPIAQPNRELPQLPPGDPYPRPNSLPAPPPTHSPSDAHPPHSYRPMNGAPPETAPPHSAPGDFRQARNPYAPPHETPAPHHGEPPGPQYMSQMPPPVAQTPSAPYEYPFSRQRKAARAQQACDQCRARKAKCDEGRPSCSHCKENSIPCVYKEIPPHKQEKATQVLLDRMDRLEERIEAKILEMFNLFASHGGVPLAAIAPTKEAAEPGESTPSALGSHTAPEPSPESPQNEGVTAQKMAKEIKDNDNNANDVLMSDVPLDEGSTASESADRVTPTLKGLPAPTLPKASIPLNSLPNSNVPLTGLPAKSLPNSHLPVSTLPRPGYKNPLMNEIAMKSFRLAEKFEEIANPPPIDEPDEKPEPKDGELSIPVEHSTAAHKLLSWPSIKRLLESNINMDYVMEGEENRGLIRIYGCGEGQEDDNEYYDDKKPSIGGSPMTASSSPSFDEEASQPSFPSWGVGLPSVPTYRPIERPGEHSRGGLDAFGQLNTHPETVRDLHRNFMENIHILHPFLDEVVLDHKISNFIKRYGGVRKNPISHTGTGSTEFRSAKRKRSSEAMHVSSVEMSRSPSSHSNFEKWPQPQRIERSIDNAIILLVLALGAICDCKDKIPKLVPDPYEKVKTEYAASSPSTRAFLSHILSPNSESHSPKMPFHSPRLTSDDGAARRRGPMRPPSATGPENPDSLTLKNMDVMPGLAYYAYATDILGNLQGGSGLLHVQAALLAGLYAGQLAHPFQSYGWIHQASRACLILVRREKYKEMKEGPMKDLHDFAYWTCLQLESDILAELDLPASGISRCEGRIDLPRGHFTLRVPQNPKNSTMMFFYSAQIHLRKVLNQIHTDLYKVSGSGKDAKNSDDLGFSSSVLEILGLNLDFWRKSLPDHMNWSEDDPPSSDINVARLRAKYYGAKYIIYRPLLHYALHALRQNIDQEESQKISQSPGQTGPKSEQISSFSTQTPQASSMTRWSSDSGLSGERNDDIHRTVDWDQLPSTIQHACETCVNAAIRSTQAFHGIKGRPIITGIFGTAHAQFGNMLVLSATYMSGLRHLVERDKLEELFIRTIRFLSHSREVSPTLWQDAQILGGIYRKIFHKSPNSSFAD